MDIKQKLEAHKLIPVISLPDVKAGPKLAGILNEHGFGVAEITFRTRFAAQGIAEIRKQFPKMTLLAGTVLFPEQAAAAVDAGAEVIVSPGTETTIIEYCKTLGAPIIPGVCTASDIQVALTKGIDILKFFPAELSGGVKAIKAMLSIYRNISFMPTGGITSANALEYLAVDRVLCCGATWLAPESLLAAGDWDGISSRIHEAAKMLQNS